MRLNKAALCATMSRHAQRIDLGDHTGLVGRSCHRASADSPLEADSGY
jgi:hypothetical protein